MSLTRPLVYCALLLFALTGLLAAPLSAQSPPPPTPTITSIKPVSNGIQFIFISHQGLNRFEVSVRTWTPGSKSWGAWANNQEGSSANLAIPNTGIWAETGFDRATLYQMRIRVWNSSNSGNRSAWAYAFLGPRYDLGPPDIKDGRLNTHPAAPVVVFSPGDRSRFYYYAVDEQSEGLLMGATPSTLALVTAEAEAATLGDTANPVSGKPVVISWDGVGLVTVSTYYADAEYAVDKPFSFTIDAEEEVTILEW